MADGTPTGLVLYDKMVAAIEAATTVDEVKEMHDKAIAVELYAIQARNDELEAKDGSDFRVLAAHKGGNLSIPQPHIGAGRAHEGDRPPPTSSSTGRRSRRCWHAR